MEPRISTYQNWTKNFIITLIIITGIILIIRNYKAYYTVDMQNQNCYNKCSDYHLLSESTHWNYNDYTIDQGDTIWVDAECYNDWCIFNIINYLIA